LNRLAADFVLGLWCCGMTAQSIVALSRQYFWHLWLGA
jgi:Mn2+/Fe2+ NRAMP family transporter